MLRWVSDHIVELRNHTPRTIESLDDRAADNWAPLLTIAEVVGDRWAEHARAAAMILSENADDRMSISEMLLGDFRAILGASPNARIRTEQLLQTLSSLGDRPWADFHGGGRALTALDLSNELRPYGIRSVKIRFGEKSYWGYSYDKHTREVCEQYAPNTERREQSEQAVPEHADVPDVPLVPGISKHGTVDLRTGKISP